jgi:hypothetical protein
MLTQCGTTGFTGGVLDNLIPELSTVTLDSYVTTTVHAFAPLFRTFIVICGL